MITDRPPRPLARRARFIASDTLTSLPLPDDDRLQVRAAAIEAVLVDGEIAPVRAACTAFLGAAAGFFGVPPPGIKVLAARPLRVREHATSELFGDYTFETRVIRVWMRTAVHHRVTSFGTFFSTLCHEFCHHLDVCGLGFDETPHTRGFYERTAALYHHGRNTSRRPLVWRRRADGTWQIDWGKMRRT